MFPHRCFLLGALASAASVLGAAEPTPLAGADAEKGRQIFVQCAVCHSTDARHGTGPGLGGVFGRKAGAAPGFRYSRAMKTAGLIWNEGSLDAYIKDPQKTVPGNVMPFSGVVDDAARRDLIAFLQGLK